MSEKIKGVFVKQMLLPKEELALQTMELMADKMELEKQVEQLENIRKEAIEYMKENCDIITIDKGWIIISELTTTGLGKLFKILNKGDSK